MSRRYFFIALVATLALAQAPGTLVVAILGPEPFASEDAQPLIEGETTAAAGSIVEVRIGAASASTVVDASGRWALRWPEALEAGSVDVTATVTDASGTATTTRRLRIDAEGRMPRRPLLERPGESGAEPARPNSEDFLEYADRWRIVPPPGYDRIVTPKGKLDPYNQNPLKGDRPIFGDRIFLSLTGISDSLFESRSVPTPSGVSAEDPGSIDFFGEGDQVFFNQSVVVSADLYKGLTTFRPADWRARATIVANFNHLEVAERGAVNPNPRYGADRSDGQLSLQELFYERKLRDLSTHYDFVSVRVGIQPFNSDFRGFIFNDTNLGARLFGNWDDNRWQYNLALFERLEKDTNSGLNVITEMRDQQVAIANVYRQDFLVPGHTIEVSAHWMRDEPGVYYDTNGFLVRPDPIGDFTPHEIEATWLGVASFGKVGRINVDGALYWVLGEDSHNSIAGVDPIGGGAGPDGVARGRASVDISASMIALELSMDRDWYRPRLGFFRASGDGDPADRDAEGFDAIFPNPNFAGGGFSFWNRLGIRLPATGVGLVHRGSLLPDLTSSKDEGQPNFVNPGLEMLTAGVDVELTPKTKLIVTGNYLRFAETAVPERVLFQGDIDQEIGVDVSAGVRWRPYLNNNVIVVGGAAVFVPGAGFEAIYEDDDVLYQLFTNLILTF
ncbi:MAG TPA: Ig-like domain-containing protein [Thermoanaerobaculia bacterium]|nr:Ig-like domain-containing protein [Thermoanaerobaculia bacterium]